MDKVSINALKEQFKERVDLFICCSGFETRSKALLTRFPKSALRKIAIIGYKGFMPKEALMNKEIMTSYSPTKTSYYEVASNDPIGTCSLFISLLSPLPDGATLLVDISSFSREYLLILLKLLTDKFPALHCKLSYTPSLRYSNIVNISSDSLKDMWLTRGVGQIRSILGYPGEFSPTKKLMLVILSGFEFERAQTVINSFEPDKLVIGRASKPESITDESADINSFIFNKLKDRNQVDDSSTFEFSCHRLKYTKDAILKVIGENRDRYNIVICPMNTKLSTIAVASAAMQYPDVQVCYAPANQYNASHYSEPFVDTHVYIFNLDEIF